MTNSNYRKGAEYERKIVRDFRDKGCLAARTAGSHSPIDVFVVDHVNKNIILIQAKKGKSYSQNAKNKLLKSLEYLEGTYKLVVDVWD